MKDNGENLDFLERPVYELLAKGYADSLYLVLVFAEPVEPDADDQKSPDPVDIVIFKPRKSKRIWDYLEEIKNKVAKEVKKEIGL